MDKSSTKNLDQLAADEKKRLVEKENHTQTYGVEDGCIVWNRFTSDGIKSTPLCNFSAQISLEEIHDDGAETKMEFVIEGRSKDGKAFSPARISSEKYSGMAWLNGNWGTKAIVYAGQNTKDHLRVGIQTLSGDVPRRTVYTHFGWRKINGKCFYLHAGGAICETGLDTSIQVSTDDRLKHYVLPSPPSGPDLQRAIQSSLLLLKLAPSRITAPLLASIYRAPLGDACDIDFSLFLTGPSGCQKSETAAIVQAHFGKAFKRPNLPGNWSSTGNSLERQAFLVKDAIFTVDDYAPTGSASDVARLNKEADRLLRGQGNKAGRGRLNSDAKLRPQYFSRGLILSTGEDVPRGPSLRARALILEMNKGDVNTDCLTLMQGYSALGLLVEAMAGYIQWLAPQMDSLKTRLPTHHRKLRGSINLGASSHARTPDLVISLGIGLEIFLQYAFETQAISEIEKKEIWDECWSAIQESGKYQKEFQDAEDPALKFMELLRTAIVSGRAHLADAKTGGRPHHSELLGWRPVGSVIKSSDGSLVPDHWRPGGDHIGWVNEDEILLIPGAAYASVQDIARKQNDSMPTSEKTLWKRLVQRGIVSKGEEGKNLSKRTVMGKRSRVLVISNKEALYSGENGGIRDNGDKSAPSAAACPQKVPLKSETPEEWGQEIGAEIRSSQGGAPIVPIAPISKIDRGSLYV